MCSLGLSRGAPPTALMLQAVLAAVEAPAQEEVVRLYDAGDIFGQTVVFNMFA